MMNTTRTTLLNRVRDHNDEAAWGQFFDLYAPILYRFARSRGLSQDTAEEVRDQCLEVVARKMPNFEYDRSKGGFKSWLYRIAQGKIIDQLRKRKVARADTQELRGLRDQSPTPEEAWEKNWRHEHLKFCLDRARLEVSDRDFQAFTLLLEQGKTVPEVCEQLQINANQVYKAKMRVLQRVRLTMKRLGT